MVNENYYMWVEIGANKKRILDEQYFEGIICRCADAGIGSIIIGTKDTTGFGIHKSSIVPHYSLYDSDFDDIDYLDRIINIVHKKGIKVFAAVDVFAEGRVKEYNELSPGFIHSEWQTHMYGIDSSGKPAVRPITNLSGIKTTGSIDDFSEVFVNPVREDVRGYEVGLIKEIVDKYNVDGVVLDRVRFVGLGSDFSDYTKKEFEKFLGVKVDNWPEDIYRLRGKGEKIEVEYGPLFGKWMIFRAGYIKQFIKDAGEAIKASGKSIQFIDYTGSWYPEYYLVGANWASERYIPVEYPWVKEEYSKTGYAEYIDKLLSGFYYCDVTIEEALKNNMTEYWYSVEGAANMANKVVMGSVPVIGSLFVQQYQDRPEVFRKAVEMCFKKSNGCMIFDLCYIDGYDWWDLCKIVL